jgi:hypothetical protein
MKCFRKGELGDHLIFMYVEENKNQATTQLSLVPMQKMKKTLNFLFVKEKWAAASSSCLFRKTKIK